MFALNGKYPIDDEGQVKIAMDFFNKNMSKLDIKSRIAVARNLKKQASSLKVDYTNYSWITNYSRPLEKNAKVSPDFSKSIKSRKDVCKNSKISINGKKIESSKMLDKIANQVGVLHPIHIMSSLIEFDKAANLCGSYDSFIDDPIMSVFGSNNNPEYDSVKVASNMSDYDINRCLYNKGKMDKIAEKFGNEFKVEFAKSPKKSIEKIGSIELGILTDIIKG